MSDSQPMRRAVLVYCLRQDAYQNPRQIFLYGLQNPQTGKTLWLCNCCDHMDGSAICRRCCDSASLLLASQPELPISGPIDLGAVDLPKDRGE